MNILRNKTIIAIAVGTTLVSTAFGAGYKSADKTGKGIAAFRDEVIKGKAAVDLTMKCLGDVASTANTDPRKAFQNYSKSVSKLESTAASIRKRAATMKEKGAAYFKEWQEELAQVKNPEIRALAEQRKAKLQETFDSIRQHSDPVKAQFDPWMLDLKDLENYLSNDLTIAGVDAAKPLFTKTTNGGIEIQKSMDGLITELNTLAATITPSKEGTQKAPPPAATPASTTPASTPATTDAAK